MSDGTGWKTCQGEHCNSQVWTEQEPEQGVECCCSQRQGSDLVEYNSFKCFCNERYKGNQSIYIHIYMYPHCKLTCNGCRPIGVWHQVACSSFDALESLSRHFDVKHRSPLRAEHAELLRFSTAWYGTVRHGSVRYGTAQFESVAFPPQFSTAIEWAGLFTRRYNCAASTAVTSS